MNILNTTSVALPVLSHSLAPKSPRPRKSSDASPAMLHAVKYERYTPRMHACIGRAGAMHRGRWALHSRRHSACRPPLARRNERNTRDASTMSIRPRHDSFLAFLTYGSLRFTPRYNIVRYCAGVLCNFRNVSKVEEDRPAVGCSGNVVSLKWAARQFLGKCIPQVYRKNGKTAGLKCARESASAHTGGTMKQFCNIL